MEKEPIGDYLLEKYGERIYLTVYTFVSSVTNNRNLVAKKRWNDNGVLRNVMVEGLIYEGLIYEEEREIRYKLPWLKELKGLSEIVESLTSDDHS